MQPTRIDDPDDPRVALYRHLPDAVLRGGIEGRYGVFVVEGARTVRVLLGTSFPVLSVLLLSTRLDALADVVRAAQERDAPVYVADRATLDRIAGFPIHRGVLALAQRRPEEEPMALLAQVEAAVIVEGVNDHENLGAIFRNTAALGGRAVLLDPACCDPLYRRSVRVSVGQVLRVPFARLTPWPGAVAAVGQAGFAVVALDPGGPESIESVAALTAGRRLAVLVGAEGNGLSEAARAAATHRVHIPMVAGVDSLNVATALAIALHRLVPVG